MEGWNRERTQNVTRGHSTARWRSCSWVGSIFISTKGWQRGDQASSSCVCTKPAAKDWTFSGTERWQRERVYMHILVSTIKINILLKIFNRVHHLTWHNGAIPDQEIWIKLGGDKGGGTFKFNFQICNTPTPNSPRNTCVFSIFAGRWCKPFSHNFLLILPLAILVENFTHQIFLWYHSF